MTLKARFTEIPQGDLRAEWNGRRLEAAFTMQAQFDSDTGNCSNGVYRQYVKGKFLVNGKVHQHVLCAQIGSVLSEDEFKEDGCGYPGCTAYGHRPCANAPKSKYEKTADTGCVFYGEDEPGIASGPGNEIEMDLSFQGKLIDTSTGEVLEMAEWTAKGRCKVPDSVATVGAVKLKNGREVRVMATPRDDGWDITLVIPHEEGEPPFPAKTMSLTARDRRGLSLPVSPITEVSVAGRAGNMTTNAFVRVEGKEPPVTAEVALANEHHVVSLARY